MMLATVNVLHLSARQGLFCAVPTVLETMLAKSTTVWLACWSKFHQIFRPSHKQEQVPLFCLQASCSPFQLLLEVVMEEGSRMVIVSTSTTALDLINDLLCRSRG